MVSKGDRVVILGTVRTNTWTPKGSDTARSRQLIVADEIAVSLRYAMTKRPRRAIPFRRRSRPSDYDPNCAGPVSYWPGRRLLRSR